MENDKLENKDVKPEKDDEKKVFDQADVDAIVQKRLKKAELKHKEELKKLQADSLPVVAKKFGIEASEVEKLVEVAVTKEQLANLAEEAEELGVSPEFLLSVRKVEQENAVLRGEKKAIDDKAQQEVDATAEINKQIEEFEKAFPEIDVTKLNNDPTFQKFYKKLSKDVSLAEGYEEYSELVGDAKMVAMNKALHKEERSLNSDNHAKGGNGVSELTAEQKQLCKENGIDEKKFLEDYNRSIYRKK